MNKLPDDLKSINSIHELSFLARKIRKRIVSVVSHNGGHLSSNLGSVDAIISILKQAVTTTRRPWPKAGSGPTVLSIMLTAMVSL